MDDWGLYNKVKQFVGLSFCNRFRYKSKHFISFIRLFLQNVLLLHQLIQHDTNIIRYVPGAEHCLTLDKQG